MSFINLCKERFNNCKSVLCIGLDPVIEKIPFKDQSNIEKKISDFYYSIIDNFQKYAIAVKPNIAFYEQYGIDGYNALKNIIKRAKKYDIPVILDAKRGDIGNTSKAYAKAAFEELKVDAITLSPYLGEDSLIPFFEYKDKGFFILVRTSNSGSNDIQLLELKNNKILYQEIANKIIDWNKKYSTGIGAVIGATHINELKDIISVFKNNIFIPILIPGVGSQGGDFKQVINILNKFEYPLHIVFINSSSKINYAYLDHPEKDFFEATFIEIKKMLI